MKSVVLGLALAAIISVMPSATVTTPAQADELSSRAGLSPTAFAAVLKAVCGAVTQAGSNASNRRAGAAASAFPIPSFNALNAGNSTHCFETSRRNLADSGA